MKGIILRKSFQEFNSPYHLYRKIYQYTPCGPTVGILYRKNRTDKFSCLYCDDLPGEWDGEIQEIHVSSIVEGVDECTETHIIKCNGSAKKIRSEFYSAVDAVNKEADYIWDETHGCEGCAKLFDLDFMVLETPVHKDCKECGGHGGVY